MCVRFRGFSWKADGEHGSELGLAQHWNMRVMPLRRAGRMSGGKAALRAMRETWAATVEPRLHASHQVPPYPRPCRTVH
jgi:hypothetical protein